MENERGPAEREEPKQGKQPRQPIALAHPFLGGSAVRNGEVSPVQRARGEPLRRGGRLGGARRALGVVVRGDDAHLAWWCARAPSSRSEFVSPGSTYYSDLDVRPRAQTYDTGSDLDKRAQPKIHSLANFAAARAAGRIKRTDSRDSGVR